MLYTGHPDHDAVLKKPRLLKRLPVRLGGEWRVIVASSLVAG
jgi:hypothetical protein